MTCVSHGVCMCRQAQAHADMLQGKQPIAPADSTVTSAAAATAAADSHQIGKEPSSGKRPGKLLIACWPLWSTHIPAAIVARKWRVGSCRVLEKESLLSWIADLRPCSWCQQLLFCRVSASELTDTKGCI